MLWCYYGESWWWRSELVGLSIALSHLIKLINQNDVGLFRDDGLIIFKSLNCQQIDGLRKSIAQVFKNFGFKMEIKTKLTESDFLDVTFCLIKKLFLLYKKSNNNLSYINAFSNHLPNIIKGLSNSIDDLLLRKQHQRRLLKSIWLIKL